MVGSGGDFFAAVARAIRNQRRRAGAVQRKRVEVTLTKQISRSAARISRQMAVSRLRDRVE